MGRKRKHAPKAFDMKAKPFACRLPVELHAGIEGRAIAEGISPSELVRNVLFNWLYGQEPSANEGYYQARGIASQIAHFALEEAIESLPSSYEEMVELLAEMAAKRAQQRGDKLKVRRGLSIKPPEDESA